MASRTIRALTIIADNEAAILRGVLTAWLAIGLLCAAIAIRLPDAPSVAPEAANPPAASNLAALGRSRGKDFQK